MRRNRNALVDRAGRAQAALEKLEARWTRKRLELIRSFQPDVQRALVFFETITAMDVDEAKALDVEPAQELPQ